MGIPGRRNEPHPAGAGNSVAALWKREVLCCCCNFLFCVGFFFGVLRMSKAFHGAAGGAVWEAGTSALTNGNGSFAALLITADELSSEQ